MTERDELRCVISDLADQVRERDAEIERLTIERDAAIARAERAERVAKIKPGGPAHVALWDAINAYAISCGGDASAKTISDARMLAVSAVERALVEACEGETNV